ncbi:MAG TPA: hypothetical protein VNT24_01385 [Propionibacteriaceae bacterium]|nr:hypothetical protein [Propionibacteriaceae bacterium]
MARVARAPRPVVVAAAVAVVAAVGGVVAWRATPLATTRVLDRGDARFDVLVQRRTERLGTASAELRPPVGQPQLTAAQAWSIAGMKVQPGRRKPSVRLATFVDPDFPKAAGPDNRMVPVAKRALVWVVVVPDAPAGFISGPVGRQERRPARQYACTNSIPVHAMTGASLGFWQDCWPVTGRTDRESA